MVWQSGLYVYLMLAAGAVSLTVAFLTHRRRRVAGWRSLVAINCVGALWALTTAAELSSASLEQAVFFHKLSFFGMEAIGVAWFMFTARFSGRDQWLAPLRVAALSALPVTTLVLLATNQYHGLVFKAFTMEAQEGFLILHKTPGAWWWLDSLYTYGLLLAGVVVLGVMFFREIGLYRRQIAAIVAGLVVPWGSDLLYVSFQGAVPVNLTPALFAWVGIVLYWGFVRYHLLDVAPVAREFVTQHLSDALVVFDQVGRVTYLNLAAEGLLATKLQDAVGKPLEIVAASSPGLFALYTEARASDDDALQDWESGGRHYDGRVSSLRDKRGNPRGTVLVLRDTTDRKVAELALDEARRDLEQRVVERTAQLEAEKAHLAHLNAVAVEIARCETSDQVLEAGARLARKAVGAEADGLWLRSRFGEVELAPNADLPPELKEQVEHLFATSSVFKKAVAEGIGLYLDGPGDLKAMVVPLISRGLNLGGLCLFSSDPAFGHDPEASLLAGAMASQIAVALENARRFEEAQFLAERDSLTLLLNHRGLSKRLEQEVALAERSSSVFSLVMIDVDNFKSFNDAYGHVVGDRVLQQVSQVLTTSLRRSDVVGRYGGDEFVAVLPDTDAESAVQLVERIRTTLDQGATPVGDAATVPLKMSYGVATYPYDGSSSAEVLAAADANLYRSKRQGGDFITASGSTDLNRPAAVGAFSVLDGLVTTVDKKDHYTRRHSDNVTEHALALAAKMGLSVETQRSLRVAALLHDVGKLGVPDRILRKPAGLNEAEFEAIKTHVTLGELIIQGIPNQEEVLSAVTTHHERYDGAGYPKGLAGEQIPLLGRILAVTDAYSAMTVDRPYRKALSAPAAISELKRVAGSQLDATIVQIFLEVLADDEAVQKARVAVFAHGG